ncbi:MAG: DUF3987 domain-containing protein, partial [Alphaproteobacteria bacterium]
SLSVNSLTGAWADFATGEKGGDLIALYAAIKGLKQSEAARDLGGETYQNPAPGTLVEKPTARRVIAPVPDGTERHHCIHGRWGAPTRVWDYLDKDGKLLGHVARYDPPMGKEFIPYTLSLGDTGGYRWGGGQWPKPRPLYGLRELHLRPDDPVLIVEGEKAADAAKLICPRYVVVTWPGGATAWKMTDFSSVYRRKDVLLWPDNDDPGLKAMWDIGHQLRKHCQVVKIILPEGVPAKFDAADGVALKWKWDDFSKWARPLMQIIADSASDETSPPDIDFDDLAQLHAVVKSNALPEPEPLRATMAPAKPYPVEMLGEVLGSAAKALHEVVMAPLAMCCQSVLAAASLAAQAHFDVLLPWGERKPLSLFLLTVGESGERKSSIDDLVLGAAKAQERSDIEMYEAALKNYEIELSAWKLASDAAGKAATTNKKGSATAADVLAAITHCGVKPAPPVAPLRFVSDPTVEGLFKLLAAGQPSVALFSDEGGLLIGGHALNSDNALKTLARWCKLWDGSPFDRVRAGDGAGVLYGRRMALHQLAQPEVMVVLLSDRMANGQGFLARCLTCWPESTIGVRQVKDFEWAGDRPEMKRLYARLKSLMEALPRTNNNSPQELDPIELTLLDAAKALTVTASNEFERLMAKGADLAELRDRGSKALENACRIAGVLAVMEGGMATRCIELDHMQRGLSLVQWYLEEALRMRGAASAPQSVTDAEMLSAWLKEKNIKIFRSRQILNAGPNPLRNKPRMMAAIGELTACGYLAANEPGALVDGVAARLSWRVLYHVV